MLDLTNVLYMVSSIYNQIKFQAQTTLDSVVNFIQIWGLLSVIYKLKISLIHFRGILGVYKYSNLFLEVHQSGICGFFHLERGAIEPLYGTLDSPRGRKKLSMAPPDALGLLLMFIFNYRHHFECDNVY